MSATRTNAPELSTTSRRKPGGRPSTLLILIPRDPLPSPSSILNALQQVAPDWRPSVLLSLAPWDRPLLEEVASSLSAQVVEVRPRPSKPSRSAHLLFNQRAVDLCDALLLLRRPFLPTAHMDIFVRATRDGVPVRDWWLGGENAEPLLVEEEDNPDVLSEIESGWMPSEGTFQTASDEWVPTFKHEGEEG